MSDESVAALPRARRGVSAWVSSVAREIRSDYPLYTLTALYLAVAAAVAALAGAEHKLRPFLYIGKWLVGTMVIAVVAVVAGVALPAIARDPHRPFARFCGDVARIVTPRLVAGLLLFCAMPVFYGTFTSLKNMLPDLAAYAWDPALADADAWLHGGVPSWRLAHQAAAGSRLMAEAIQVLYSVVWQVVMLAVPLWAAVSTRHAQLRRRFFTTLFVSWALLGNIAAGVFLSGGPAFFADLGGDRERFAPLTEFLASFSAEPHSAFAMQRYLWRLHEQGAVEFATGISAFPSMHLAITTLYARYLWSVDRRLGVAGAALTVLMQFGSVYLGWHYAIDGYVSVVSVLLLWWAFGRVGKMAEGCA